MSILIRHLLITNSNLRPNKAIFNNVADFKLANISKCHNKQNTKRNLKQFKGNLIQNILKLFFFFKKNINYNLQSYAHFFKH